MRMYYGLTLITLSSGYTISIVLPNFSFIGKYNRTLIFLKIKFFNNSIVNSLRGAVMYIYILNKLNIKFDSWSMQ
jgi:hypothetical protein